MTALTTVSTYVAPGRLAFGAVAATHTQLFSSSGLSGRKLYVTNSLDTEVVISLNNGTTDFLNLPPGVGIVIDFDTSMHWAGTVTVKYFSAACTSGFICAGVLAGN